jgi:hypothetical protein
VIFFSALLGFCNNNSETNNNSSKDIKPVKDTITKPAHSQKINVYYFHTSYRCPSCNMIEGLTKEAITGEFSQELEKGTITFTSINVETDMNKHFIQKYKLVSKSIIISRVLDNKEKEWKNLDKIWFLLRDPDKYKQYVLDEIKKYQTDKRKG